MCNIRFLNAGQRPVKTLNIKVSPILKTIFYRHKTYQTELMML